MTPIIPPTRSASRRPTGMLAFGIVWIGQAVSMLGSSMTGFALSIWAFQMAPEGMRATVFSLMQVFYIVPMLLMTPFAGAIVDRSNRKLMMIISDFAAGLGTLAILILYSTGLLALWHLFVVHAVIGFFHSFQWPAYSATITLMVDKKHYARTSAMNQLAGNTSGIFAPLLAGAIIGLLDPDGILIILLIDVVTFVAAISAILFVHIPQPPITTEGAASRGSLLSEAMFGFKYIFQRASLLGLQLTFLFGNFFFNMAHTLLAPMVLARTASNSLIFGSVQTAGAVGGVVGGLLISAWGGPKRKALGVTLGWAMSGIAGLVIGLGQSLPLWAVGLFIGGLIGPLIDSSNQAIWQSKVPPDVQGRVFSARLLIAWIASPLAAAVAGPLADRLLEPAMLPGGGLAEIFGGLVGVGPGSGMSLVFIFAGILVSLVGLIAFLTPAIRHAETLLPDPQPAKQEEPPSV
jgi:MFS transporter, DHA3 family, macrolide efflux protein